MDLIDREALMKTFDAVQKSDPMADNGRGYDDHFINDAGEPSAEWFCVEDYVLKMPTIPAVPLEPLCEWLGKRFTLSCKICQDVYIKKVCPYLKDAEMYKCNSPEHWKALLTKWMEEQQSEMREMPIVQKLEQ